MDINNFTASEADAMVANVTTFKTAVSEFLERQGTSPTPASQAIAEANSFRSKPAITSTQQQGAIMLEVASDHMIAFTGLATRSPHATTIAPWTCVRSILESSALSKWLFDTNITPEVRVGRGYAFRFEGLEQQVKFGRSAGKPNAELDAAVKRIDSLEADATGAGYSAVIDRAGKRIGIYHKMPAITDLIRDVLQMEDLYRLLSATAHCHLWALQQLGFRITHDATAGASLERHIEPFSIGLLCHTAVRAYTSALWSRHQYYGADIKELGSILDDSYDSMNFNDAQRCWKP